MKRTVVLVLSVCIFAAAMLSIPLKALAQSRTSDFIGNVVPLIQNGKQTAMRAQGAVSYKKDVGLPFAANFELSEDTAFVTAELKDNGESVIKLDFVFDGTLKGTAVIGSGNAISFTNLKLLEGKEIQFSIAKERETDTETGANFYRWAIRINSFVLRLDETDERAQRLDELQNEKLKYSFTSNNSVDIHVIAENYLYGYEVIENSIYVKTDTLGYSSLVLAWNIPEGYEQKGFIIERFNNGVPEKTSRINSGAIASMTEKYLEQGVKYTYRVTAYDDLNVRTTPCPKILYVLKDFDATTEKGNLIRLILIIAALALAIAAAIVLYVFRYKIFKEKKVK